MAAASPLPVEPVAEAPERVFLWRMAAQWRRVAHDPGADIVARADAASKLAGVLGVLAWRAAKGKIHDDE